MTPVICLSDSKSMGSTNQFIALLLFCIHCFIAIATSVSKEGCKIINLNFQLPLRYQEFFRLWSVEHLDGKFIVYYHVFSNNDSEICTYPHSRLFTTAICGTWNEGKRQFDSVIPLQLTSQTLLNINHTRQEYQLLDKFSDSLAVQPKLYKIEFRNKNTEMSLSEKVELEIETSICIPFASHENLCLQENSQFCKQSRLFFGKTTGGSILLQGDKFINGFLIENQNVRLSSISYNSKQTLFGIKGTILVMNFSYQKSVIVKYFFGNVNDNNSEEQFVTATWARSINSNVDEFIFEIQCSGSKKDSDSEIKLTITKIEYVHSNEQIEIDNNNGVGYAMLINSPLEKMCVENRKKYINAVLWDTAYRKEILSQNARVNFPNLLCRHFSVPISSANSKKDKGVISLNSQPIKGILKRPQQSDKSFKLKDAPIENSTGSTNTEAKRVTFEC